MLFQEFCSRKRAVLCTQRYWCPWVLLSRGTVNLQECLLLPDTAAKFPVASIYYMMAEASKGQGWWFLISSGFRNQTLDLHPSVWPAPSIFLCTLPPPEFISGISLKTSVKKPRAFSFLLVSRGSPRSCWPCIYSLDPALLQQGSYGRGPLQPTWAEWQRQRIHQGFLENTQSQAVVYFLEDITRLWITCGGKLPLVPAEFWYGGPSEMA